MGLIDADKIINRLDAVTKDGGENVKVFSINVIKYLLNNEPTAYDVDKVVEQLKSESARWQDSGDAYNDEKEKGVAIGFRKAIEIVKGGGVDAKTDS